MIKISVIIIAKNAEELIKDCIKSVDFADEIIVIDDDSTDNTREVAKKLGARVIEESAKSFAEKRNIGLRHAKGEWVLYIDTDERVSKELKKSIQNVVTRGSDDFTQNSSKQSDLEEIASSKSSRNNDIVAYKLQRQNFYLGNNPWPKIEKLERLFRRANLKEWYGELHEGPRVEGLVGELEGLLFHYTHRDLSSMLSKTIEWSDKEAKLRFDAHHPKMALWRFPRVMLTTFIDSYFKQGGYKAGTVGLIESIYQAYSIFVTYAKLWELQQKSTSPKT